MQSEELQEGAFRFEYTTTSLDWYDIVKVEIKPDDYCYFRLERRYGKTWWLVGMNPPANWDNGYKMTEKQLGRISEHDLARFIEWAKNQHGGSDIVELRAISGEFDILQEIAEILRRIDKCKTN